MVLCDTVPGCVDVSFVRKSGGACYLKNGLGKTVKDDRILAGRLLVPGGNGPSAASISTTTSTSSTATTSSPASETTSISVPVTTAGPSSSKSVHPQPRPPHYLDLQQQHQHSPSQATQPSDPTTTRAAGPTTHTKA